ncbi:MAG: TIR domain-containing protein [Hyphomonas sp.]|nr:TIR domain-containing protein [Hyphomonas sp.]
MSKVFVSFDYENDRHYKFLMGAWDKNPRFNFTFRDGSSQEIKSWDIGRVKAALTQKINAATYTLVIVGRYANQRHRDSVAIGYKNWINFEVARSKLANNRIVAVKLDRSFTSPDELLGVGASWAQSFGEAQIMKALSNA